MKFLKKVAKLGKGCKFVYCGGRSGVKSPLSILNRAVQIATIRCFLAAYLSEIQTEQGEPVFV